MECQICNSLPVLRSSQYHYLHFLCICISILFRTIFAMTINFIVKYRRFECSVYLYHSRNLDTSFMIGIYDFRKGCQTVNQKDILLDLLLARRNGRDVKNLSSIMRWMVGNSLPQNQAKSFSFTWKQFQNRTWHICEIKNVHILGMLIQPVENVNFMYDHLITILSNFGLKPVCNMI